MNVINVSNDTKASNDAAADAASQRPMIWPAAPGKEAPVVVVSADEAMELGGEELGEGARR